MKNTMKRLVAVILMMTTLLCGSAMADVDNNAKGNNSSIVMTGEAPKLVASEKGKNDVVEKPAKKKNNKKKNTKKTTKQNANTKKNTNTVNFKGKAEIKRQGNGPIFFGDEVTLLAVVSGANMDYSIRWEALINGQWKTVCTESEYTFVVTESNASYTYRVVLVVEG